jgi:GT2 family glycosyltransferase
MHFVEAVIINWKRPQNVKQIVQALKQQTVPVTITVCDCHPEPSFSLDEETIHLVDRVYRWTHNLGAYSRYTPLASFDHPYTFFIDDDLLPGKKCVEAYLQAATEMPEFGVFGQLGRIMDASGIFRGQDIPLTESFIETDFIVRAYFVKTRHLYNIVRFRWEIGYFEEPLPEDDLLLCAALKYYDNLPCYLIPYHGDQETLVRYRDLNSEHALSSRINHYYKRTQFVKRLMYYGWTPLIHAKTSQQNTK